jgi:hypothetical protein
MNGEPNEMKPPEKNRFLMPVLAGLLVMVSAQGAAGSAGVTEQWQPASDWERAAWPPVGDRGVPLRYDSLLLELGRSVYADLQEARQAALDKEATNLRAALREARDTVHRLALPPEFMALEAQLRVIRNDLKDRSKSLDGDLWVPVEAEIDQVLVYAPEALQASAKAGVRNARAATARGDRAAASAQLDVVTSTLQYSLGIFPLHKVKQDLAVALAAATMPTPDWSAALQAVQSSLAAFHWYTQAPAHGLLSAYNAVISAYALAAGPQFRPDQRQKVLDYLGRAEKDLSDTPGAGPLAAEAHGLIDKVDPPGRDIKMLLQDIQSQIDLQRQRAENHYWDAIGRTATE